MPGFATLLKGRFLRFRREILMVLLAIRNPATPLHLRIAGLLLVIYLMSPLDLIPVMIPVLGLLDDLIIVPWGMSMIVKRLPEDVRASSEIRAERLIQRYVRRPLLFLGLLVLGLVLVWVTILWLLWYFLF